MTDDHDPTRTEGEGETLDMPEGTGAFSKGQILGERYQILEMLGRGGMGEVWHAFDLKLRVEVALKALRPEFFKSERRLDMLRQEVRAAREVMSPNVCRIFDLIEIEGGELVSMEYVDGATLLAVLHERGPLELKEAQDIASQFLAGLEAIHKVGLVHRDIKPENIMLTRAGRVVVMDFGLARQEEEGGGSVAGTPAYMSPEQAAGQTLDPRADVYSAGVVLAEMVSPDGIIDLQSRQSLWEGVRSEPAKIPETPWAKVIEKAVARDREHRFNTAHTLTRALEDVTLRVEGADDLHPYPGLSCFTQDDAEYFFGREAEIEQMWRKLEGPPRMQGLVGPSGAGKSSFIRAGVFPTASTDWSCLVCAPGDVPVLSLGRALARAMPGDPEIVEQMLSFDDPDVAVDVVSRWRSRSDNALVVVDQFEELFTQNAADVQRRFADLLARMVLEADVHVLISMRDDFLFRCSDQPALTPVFSEVTPLRPPIGGALRRAVVQPAMKCGYRFEDDELVEEILAEVEGERGALPLLAFSASRVWELRDRDNGQLTRQAYEDIGGVGGALARHAESTVDRIGTEHIATVRELFRNLVTSDGTRAVREWRELLSVFEEGRQESAENVLRGLIDARLLTSYEIREDEHEPIRRVEIIHESLLANWPRLVRWQTQDQEGAQLRDELRQSARSWDEHGRHDDRLWTGTAFREYTLWRERYPGGLTLLEEAFGAAMTAFATRRKRRRQIAVASVLIALLTGLLVVGAFWQRSARETLRAEAQKLVALGQLQLEDHPTSTLAYATASLGLSDTEEARLLAVEALWEGPTAFIVNEIPSIFASFSEEGNWLVQAHDFTSSLSVISRNGQQKLVDHPSDTGTTRTKPNFSDSEGLFCSLETSYFALWSARDGRLLAHARLIDDTDSNGGPPVINEDGERSRALFAEGKGNLVTVHALHVDGRNEKLGEIRLNDPPGTKGRYCLDQASGAWLAVVEGNDVSVVKAGQASLSGRHLLGRHMGDVDGCMADPLGRFFLTFTRSGEIRRWDPSGELEPTDANLPPDFRPFLFSNNGSHMIAWPRPGNDVRDTLISSIEESGFRILRRMDNVATRFSDFDSNGLRLAARGPLPAHRLWSLAAPAGAKPIVLRRGPSGYTHIPSFSPDGRWLATNDHSGLAVWPLAHPYPAVIDIDFKPWSSGVAFGPDGQFLATSAGSEVRVWPLVGAIPPTGHVVFNGTTLRDVAVSPDGETFAAGVGAAAPAVWVGRKGEEPLAMPSAEKIKLGTGSVSFSADGRFVAALDGGYDLVKADYRVWDVATSEEIAVLHLDGEQFRVSPGFVSDGRLLISSTAGMMAWDVETGDHEVLVDIVAQWVAASDDGRRLLITEAGENEISQDPAGSPVFVDLDNGTSNQLAAHGLQVQTLALDQAGTIAATGDSNGVIRVGPVTGEEPHLLFGHEGLILDLAIDPLGRWIASAAMDNTLRLWPIPDFSKPPLHTLPREELIAKLKTLTNLRVVRDEDSPTGWKLTHDPFPGWETVPTW